MYVNLPVRRRVPSGLAGLGRLIGPYIAPKPGTGARPAVNSMDPRARAHQEATARQFDAEKLASTPWGKSFNPPPLVNGRMTKEALLYTIKAWNDGLNPAGFRNVERVGLVPMFQPGQQAYGKAAAEYLQKHAPDVYQQVLSEMRTRDRKAFTKSLITIATIAVGGYLAGSAMAAANASAAAGTAASATTAGTTSAVTTGAGVQAGTTGVGMTAGAGQAAYAGQIAAAQTAAASTGVVGASAAASTGSLVTSAAKTAATTVAKGALAQAKNVAVSYVTGKATEKVLDWVGATPQVPDGSLAPPMQNMAPQQSQQLTTQQMISAGVAVVSLLAAVLTFTSR